MKRRKALSLPRAPLAKNPDGTLQKKPEHKKNQQEGKAAKAPKSIWLKVDAKTCDACLQSTHSIDRDSDPAVPQYLIWTRKKKHAKGQ